MKMKSNIIRTLNEKYGEDLADPQKCLNIRDEHENEIKRIEAELNLSNPKSSITQTIVNANGVIDEVNKVADHTESFMQNVSLHIQETWEIKRDLEEHFNKLNMLECTLQYIKIVEQIESLSDDLQKEIKNNDDEQCATIFANMSEISRNVVNTSAVHLRNYLKETVLHWHKVLKEKFSKDFDNLLKAIKWPFVNVNVNLELPLEANIQKLQVVIEYLLQIDLPDELVTQQTQQGFLSGFPMLSLPMHLLVEPLKKRFLYHFYGTRKTNRSDKPEWYFTKILSWIRDHNDFVDKWVQPVVDKMGLYQIEAKVEMMMGLVQLAVEKLYTDLPNMQYDDFTFSHCIDEALGFDKELKESYEYPRYQAGILNVLTQAQVFIKWISMEKKYALEKMDVMLSNSFTESFYPIDSDSEDSKIAPCADMFITLLQTITDRYEVLPQPGHRLQFLELQLELLDDFRVRLLQLVHAEGSNVVDSKIPIIANTIFYIENVLVDWGSMLHFLNLHYYKSKLCEPDLLGSFDSDFDNGPVMEMDEGTVFTETLSLYRHMRKDLLLTLSEVVVRNTKACSKNYRHEMWSKLTAPKDTRSLSLTPSACRIFEVLATNLHLLGKYLTPKLFTTIWRSIAQQIDTFLFEEMVLENRFSQGGALQFQFDVARNLIPLFSQFTDKPNVYFTKVCEAAALLNIAKGSALLLRETLIALEGATGVEDRRGQALKEVGVNSFDPKMAVTVLNQRADITVDRISSID